MVRLPTVKELAEKRAKISGRMGEILKATEGRALATEERSEVDRLQTESNELQASEGEHQLRSQMERMARANPESSPDFKLATDNPMTRLDDYRLLRALRSVDAGAVIGGLEGEVSQYLSAEARAASVPTKGEFRIPHELPMFRREQRADAPTNLTTAVGAIQTSVASTFIDTLRNELILRRAGAQVVPGLVGTFKLPKKTSQSNGNWVGEDASSDAQATEFGDVEFTPKNVTSSAIISRDLMLQTSLDIDLIVRKDILDGIAAAIDLAGFHGTGSSNMPQGIASNSACPVVEIGPNGGALTWAKLMELQTAIADANVKAERLVYITSAVGHGALATTLKVAGYPVYLAENGRAASLPLLVTNQVRKTLTKGTSVGNCTALFCGDFSQVMIGLWGSVDMLFDRISNKPKLTIDCWQTSDIEFRLPQAITKCVDLRYN